MPTTASGNFFVELAREDNLGSTWIVRVFKKRLLGKKLLSSDWFLDRIQAERFVDDILHSIDETGSEAYISERKPGWTLRRPA